MNKYTWSITAMFTLPEPINNSVIRAEYLVTATNEDQSITALMEGVSQFQISLDPSNLTPYKDLTEQQVLNWVQSEPNLVTNIQANLDAQIEDLIKPPIVPTFTQLPWSI